MKPTKRTAKKTTAKRAVRRGSIEHKLMKLHNRIDKAMTSATDDAVLRMTGRGPIPNYMHKQNVARARAKAEKQVFKQLRKELGAKKFNTMKKILLNIGDNKMGRGAKIGKYIMKKSPWLGAKIISLAGLGAAGKLTPWWITQGASAAMNIMLAKDIFDLAMTDKFIQNALGLEISDVPIEEQALVDEWIREEKWSLDPNDPFFAPGSTQGPQNLPPKKVQTSIDTSTFRSPLGRTDYF